MNARSLTGLIAVALLARSSSAEAQGFSLSRFEPSERGSEWFTNESLDLRGHLRPALGVVADGAYRPLVIYNQNGDPRTSLVEWQIFMHPGASLVLWNRVRAGLSLPVAVYQTGERGSLNGVTYESPDTPALGDARLTLDVRLLGEHRDVFTLAAGVRMHAPTGSRSSFTSDGNVRFEPRLAAAGEVGAFIYAARLGLQYRGLDTRVDGSPLGSEVTFAAAAGLRLAGEKLVVGPEIFGTTVVTDSDAFFKTRGTPLDLIMGLHYTIGSGFRVGGGGGAGLSQGFGSPAARGMLSVEWAPPPDAAPSAPPADRDGDGVLDPDDACVDVRGVRTDDPQTNGCPADRDRDGILDDVDACPDVAGPRTEDPKTSGCPDRDKDGIPDKDDACVDVPGVSTADPKTNGCPPDRDKDGILDAEDACIDVPGVRTEDAKTNGCPPDPDRDRDGVPNAQDACPDEPGKPDPDPKRNGCPKAFVQSGQIRILDQVKFKTASTEILPGKESEEVLQAVLKVLGEHPEIKKLRVEGHTDNRGAAAMNQKLSAGRAASVVKWLVGHGIDAGRLGSQGFGPDRPADTNDTDAGRQNNRRVEFHIEEAK